MGRDGEGWKRRGELMAGKLMGECARGRGGRGEGSWDGEVG